MTQATRYTGKDWYGHFATSGGTAVLNGDFRSFEWNRDGEMADSTAGSDATTNEAYVRSALTASLSLLATTDGTTNWNNYFQAGTAGTLVWSTGAGTANGTPKYSMSAIVRTVGSTAPYDGMVEWSVEFGGQGDIAATTWSSGA